MSGSYNPFVEKTCVDMTPRELESEKSVQYLNNLVVLVGKIGMNEVTTLVPLSLPASLVALERPLRLLVRPAGARCVLEVAALLLRFERKDWLFMVWL